MSYNGRTPLQGAGEWSRPRKGSYCDYKQQKSSKHAIESNGAINGYADYNYKPRPATSASFANDQFTHEPRKNNTAVDSMGVGMRRNSVSYYDKSSILEAKVKDDSTVNRRESYDFGVQSYGSRDLSEINRTKINYEMPYQRTGGNRPRIQSNNFVQQDYSRDPNYTTKDLFSLSRPYMNANNNSTAFEPSITTMKKMGQIHQNQTRGEINRASNQEHFERARDLRNFEDKYEIQARYQRQRRPEYQEIENPTKYERYDRVQQGNVSKREQRGMESYRDMPSRAHNRREEPTAPDSLSPARGYDRYSGMANRQAVYCPTYPRRLATGLESQQDCQFQGASKQIQSLNLTPPRPSKQPDHSYINNEGLAANPAMSQSRRQLLIDKSRALYGKMNELSDGKGMPGKNTSQNSQSNLRKQQETTPTTNEGQVESYGQRMERIKNNKERAYDSPFKEGLKSTSDLRSRYQMPEPMKQFSQKQVPALKKSDINCFETSSIERSQGLLSKLSGIQNPKSKYESNNELGGSGGQENSRPGLPLENSNSCMNRINALNSKINEKISTLISAYEKK